MVAFFLRWRPAWRHALLALLFFVAIPDRSRQAHGTLPVATADLPADAPLSIMTYNVEGLPVPIRIGRAASLERIGDRLTQLRSDRRQPRIVVLQEVFSDDAREIARRAGYRYVANGPGRDDPAPIATDTAFLADASAWKGESGAKALGSGVQILSDYPIVAVRRIAFPTDACAGYDCLANKGVLIAWIAMPDGAAPIAIVATHLNSRTASGVSVDRALQAWKRQLDIVENAARSVARDGTAVVAAGDFNVGEDEGRIAYLAASLKRWPRSHSSVQSAFNLCSNGVACAATLSPDARSIMENNKDLQFVSHGRANRLQPDRIAVPFGHEIDGTSLSDHMGYTVYYRWRAPSLAKTG